MTKEGDLPLMAVSWVLFWSAIWPWTSRCRWHESTLPIRL